MVNFNEWLSWLLENSDKNRKRVIVVTIWVICSAENLKHPQPRSMVKWSPPPQGWLKINVDARLSIAKKRAVSDFIIRNDEEFIMGLGFQGHNLVHSVVIAEVLAMAPICTGFGFFKCYS
ncbi:hypothetical protein Goshw_009000 [Gossypium schwendimanii]|uniref:RNase H type-1 domain-containing protein n=1 Tax=Gossypium schwendimanii TaxID=34291 RepID=A0A7J9NDU5_GOSSC|nr:hypothetical protein [Gossypium schwendimanii]